MYTYLLDTNYYTQLGTKQDFHLGNLENWGTFSEIEISLWVAVIVEKIEQVVGVHILTNILPVVEDGPIV